MALTAMLAMALLPAVSHALASSQVAPYGWTEVCTPQGMQRVALDGTPLDDAVPAAGDHQPDCPYCRLSSVLPGLPPPVPSSWLAPAAAAAALPLFQHASRRLLTRASAQPRAPPALS